MWARLCFSRKSNQCITGIFGYGQRDVVLKRVLISQFVKFFLLISPSNASKYLVARFLSQPLSLNIWTASPLFL